MADMEVQTLEQAINESEGAYELPADAFLSGSMSDCAEKGFVRNATHPEASAALRTAGSSFPVMWTSALASTADINPGSAHVRFGPIAEVWRFVWAVRSKA
jgi:hypothetical protein